MIPDPELLDVRVAHLRKQVRRALTAAGVDVGGDHLIGPMVALIQAECHDVRERACGLVLTLQERGVTMDDPMMPDDVDPLGALAFNIRQHFIQHDGRIGVLMPEEG